jgi:hypothetical protein
VSRAWKSWSSGEDSALALHTVRHSGSVGVVGLVTTVNTTVDRVATHAVRRSLLERQAAALGLPLHVVELPWPCRNDVYERRMASALSTARESGVTSMVFGDLFLEDVRRFLEDVRRDREESLAGTGMTPLFSVVAPAHHGGGPGVARRGRAGRHHLCRSGPGAESDRRSVVQ